MAAPNISDEQPEVIFVFHTFLLMFLTYIFSFDHSKLYFFFSSSKRRLLWLFILAPNYSVLGVPLI